MALIPATLKRFPLVYWTAMTFELMERGSYYLMMPVIFFHAAYNVGVPTGIALVITMFMYPLQYGIPVFSGALAEKLGYRTQIIFAFSVLTVAYTLLSFANSTIMMILSVMLIGVGIGSYKPLIGATIAKSTSSADRHFAYSIYYWIVNLAAFVFPTIWVILELMGIVGPGSYAYVFRVGAVFVFMNIFIALFIFREVPRSGETKTFRDVRNNIRTAFKDKKFVVMVLLIGGFWALYSTMLNVLPMSMISFHFVPLWFTAMMIGIANPGTIILFGFFISKWSEGMESLKVVLTGIIFYLFGLAIIGFTFTWWGVVIGSVVASVGEFMVAPGYYAFISKLAPKEKVSAYLGCNFLSSMVGLAGGTFVFGQLYNIVGAGMGRPRLFYGILLALGLLLFLGFVTYYRTWGQDVIKRSRAIMVEQEGKASLATLRESPIFRILDTRAIVIVSALLIPVLLFTTFSMGTDIYYPPEKKEKIETVSWVEDSIQVDSSDYCDEGSTVSVPFNVTGIPLWFNFTLSWQDEASSRPLGVNTADSFRMNLVSPLGRVPDGGSTESYTGTISISVEAPEDVTGWTGDWTLEITCTDAGDVRSRGPFGAIVLTQDNGNDYALSGTVTHLIEKQE